MILENLRLIPGTTTVKLTADVSSLHFGQVPLWAEVDEQYAFALTSENYNAFLVALLYPAMYVGEDIHVKGAVSAKLLFNIQNYLIPLIRTYTPHCKKIKITADRTVTSLPGKERHIGTGYSAGVDSLCTIYDHLVLEENPAYRLDTLVFLNTGSHGTYADPSTEPKFRARYEYLKKTAPLPFIAVNTNIHQFHKLTAHRNHRRTVTFTSAAGVLVLEKYFSTYYVASSMSYKESILFGKNRLNKCTEAFDAILLPLLSTETLTFIADGQQYTRTQKVARIVDYDLSRKTLNVCVNGEEGSSKNCSYCVKCLRTLMTLDSLGKLKGFAHLFDLKMYRKYIFRYKCYLRVLYRTNPFARDNIDLARAHGKYVPSWPVAFVVNLFNRVTGRTKMFYK